MRAMAAPVLSHLDPDLVAMLDDVRGRLAGVFQAAPGAFSLAISGTGTSGMEAAVANLVDDRTRATGRRLRASTSSGVAPAIPRRSGAR
jgi:alanine-glyoxylate transaminase/serine-glyoxylate transaminase/serine-pyruvate transaminase